MFTRSEYLKGVCSYFEYYDQFLTEEIVEYVNSALGEKIRSSSDPEFFNDIYIREWDRIVTPIRLMVGTRAMKVRGDNWSIAGAVCIAKCAARKIYESQKIEAA
jgi:hypothetical protein